MKNIKFNYVIVFCSVLLPTVTKIRTETTGLIKTKRRLHFCPSKTNSRKYYYYGLWKSQESVYFTCGTFFTLQRGITVSYLRELIYFLVNAVLLTDPKALNLQIKTEVCSTFSIIVASRKLE